MTTELKLIGAIAMVAGYIINGTTGLVTMYLALGFLTWYLDTWLKRNLRKWKRVFLWYPALFSERLRTWMDGNYR